MPVSTTVFLSNRSQAVRLPRAVAFDPSVRDVVIFKEGHRRVIVPADRVWDDFFAESGIEFPERTPWVEQEREAF